MAKIFEDTGVGSERRKNHHELKISPRREVRQMDILVRGILLSLLTVLDNVAALEEDILQHFAPLRAAAEQELEIHSEVLELLVLSISHDGARFPVLFQRQTLLIPGNRLRLLDERGNHTRERTGLRGKLARGLMVLLESHRNLLSARVTAALKKGGRSWTQTIHRTRERNRLPNVMDSADPTHGSLEAQAKPRVDEGTVLSQIQIPVVSVDR